MYPSLTRISCLFFLFVQIETALAQTDWRLAYTPLTTPWTEQVSLDMPLPEYPRPQMVRQDWLNLNGLWEFTLLNTKNDRPERQGQILVPFPVESALSGIGAKVEPHHRMVYRRTVNVPKKWQGQRILLHFGAVDWETEVLINGKSAGKHKGGFDAFHFDITEHLTWVGEQEIRVLVTDPSDGGEQPIGKQRLEPNGIWYTATSGIWQTVWLEPVPRTYIRRFELQPDVKRNRVFVRVETEGDDKHNVKVTARALENGSRISEGAGKSGTPLLLGLNNTRRWTPDDPYLYDLEIDLGPGGDKVQAYFGMRNIAIGKDDAGFNRILLNDEFLFHLGTLDQGYFPDGLYTPPTEDAMLYDLNLLKSLGFNMIRKHVKVEPARWYHLCDKMGILVWQDMPSARNESVLAQHQFMAELQAMVSGLINHPSIVMWVPFNEGWGQYDTETIVERIRQWDKTRLINNASGWTDMGVGDVMDIHDYPGPKAPAKDAQRASVLGEFGGLGLNIQGHQWTTGGWGYELKSSPEELLEQYEDLYRRLLPMIKNDGLSAAVYTQTSDIETENNGLVTYDRRVVKMDPTLVQLAHLGQMPPKPAHPARIFIKKTQVTLASIAPGANMEYAVEGKKPGMTWLPYTAPIELKSNAIVHCRATWPDGSQSRSQQYAFRSVQARSPKAPGKLVPGISVKVFDGEWDKLPDFRTLQPAGQFNLDAVAIEPLDRKQHFGAVFEGFVEAPATGVYAFHLISDDGSRLLVGGESLIENDGLHGMKEAVGWTALKKGRHAIRIEYFQKVGGLGLEFWMANERGERLEPVLLRP